MQIRMKIRQNRQTRLGRRVGAAGFALAALCSAAIVSAGMDARADVVGRLRLHVVSAEDGKPIAGALVVLSDTANIRPSWTLTTDKRGEAFSVSLENRNWQLTRITLPKSSSAQPASTNAAGAAKTTVKRAVEVGTPIDISSFAPEQRQIRIVADTTTEATLLIDVARGHLARARGTGKEVFVSQVGTVTRRDRAFIQTYPVNPANPQSLGSVLQTVPRLSGRATRRGN